MVRGFVLAVLMLGAAGRASADQWSDLRALLLDGDDTQVEEAAQKLLASQTKESTDVILDGLAVGTGPRTAALLLGGLAGRKDPRALDVVIRYTNSRNLEVRRRATVALGDVPGDKATDALIAMLADSVEDVRGAAASALGKRKATKATLPLQKLFEKGELAAATALGQIGGPELARTMVEKVGSFGDAQLAALFGELLKRNDLGPDAVKMDIVHALGKVPGVEATTVLLTYSTSTPGAKDPKDAKKPAKAAPPPPSVAEAQKVLDQRSGP